MIILDTNVVSEIVKPIPSDRVLRWLGDQDPTTVFITAITQAEVLFGVEGLPVGKRRTALYRDVEELLEDEFEDRILPFDQGAAGAFAKSPLDEGLMGER